MTLLNRIKLLCDEHGETLASLERKMDFGNGTIRRWENTIPSGDRLGKVADFFGVTVDYLLGRDDATPPTKNRDSQLNDIYFSFAKDAQDNGIDPEDIKAILKIIKRSKENSADGYS